MDASAEEGDAGEGIGEEVRADGAAPLKTNVPAPTFVTEPPPLIGALTLNVPKSERSHNANPPVSTVPAVSPSTRDADRRRFRYFAGRGLETGSAASGR